MEKTEVSIGEGSVSSLPLTIFQEGVHPLILDLTLCQTYRNRLLEEHGTWAGHRQSPSGAGCESLPV